MAGRAESLLLMRGITKDFPGVRALDNVTFELDRGEVHALVGENGAGKTTLIKILAGAIPADAGEIFVEGRRARISSPLDALELGVSVIYQEFNLVPQLSVAENIFLGREPRGRLGFVDFRRMREEARRILGRIGADFDPSERVGSLSVAQQQMVEIAKALSRRAKILVMDEPTAALTEQETARLFGIVRGLKEQGVGVIYISHRIEEVFEIADRVTVLRDGKVVGTRPVSELDRETLIRMMVGREVSERIPKVPAPVGEVILEVRGLCSDTGLRDVSFALRRGEILGIAGLVGAGRTELARCIFGADPITAGEILLEGRPVRFRSPRDAIAHGIALVPEDRKEMGLVLSMVVRENMTLANMGRVTRWGFVLKRRERRQAEGLIAELAIRPPDPERVARYLSGGNQQKVVLAKWLFTHAKVLIFDEPTRGIDVGAKYEIYQLLGRLAAQGKGIILISSELPEILGLSDRILVMHEGRIAGELGRGEATQERILHLATGGL